MPKHILPILLALNGWTDLGSDPFTCFIEGDPPDPGNKDKDKGKTFTQEQLDAVVEERLRRERSNFDKKLADATKAESDKGAALQKQLDELTAKLEDAGKSTSDKELNALKRQVATLTQNLADATKLTDATKAERDAAITRHRDEVVGTRFQSALSAAKVLPTALAGATTLLRSSSQVEMGEDGKLSVTWNGRVYAEDKLAQLGKDFLEATPYLAAHPGGGTGNKNGHGAPAATGEFDEKNFGQGLAAYGRSAARSAGAHTNDDI